jgi:adenine phosphoribosyltransferase
VVKVEIDIRHYEGQTSDVIKIGKVVRSGRIDLVEPDLWIVGNDHLCYGADREVTEEIADMMAERLKPYGVECILAAVAKPVAMAYETSKRLDVAMRVTRKNIVPEAPIILKELAKSITSGKEEYQMIDGETAEFIRGKKIALLDDTISTTGTMLAMKKIAIRAGAEVSVIAAAWIEGSDPYKVFEEEFRNNKFIYLATFPLLARGQVYNNLIADKKKVEKMFKDLPDKRSVSTP